MVNGRSSPVPSFLGHSEPTLPTVGLWGPGDGRTHWSVQLWVGVFSPNNGAHLWVFHNRYECDRRHGVCVYVSTSLCVFASQAAVRESTIDWGRGEGTYGEQGSGEEPAQMHSSPCPLDRKGAGKCVEHTCFIIQLVRLGFFHEYCITSLKCLWCRTLFFSRNSRWTSVAWTIQHIIHSASSNSPEVLTKQVFSFPLKYFVWLLLVSWNVLLLIFLLLVVEVLMIITAISITMNYYCNNSFYW